MSIIEIENLEKTFKVLNRHEGLKGAVKDLFSHDYKYIKAVDKISMKINAGEIVGYLGPNGAGKSTTIKMMTGVLDPTSGHIKVNGNIPYKNRRINAQNIGVVFGQRTQLWWSLPVIESFKILKMIYQINDKTYKDNLELFDSLVKVSSLYSKPVRQMSLGQRTLCDILAAFLHDPKVIFLDEPTIGLDVSIKSKIRMLIKELNARKNTTVILTTHDMGDVEALCQRAVIIDKGKIIFDDQFESLKSMFGSYRTLKVSVDDMSEKNINDTIRIIESAFNQTKALTVNRSEDWIEIIVDQDKTALTDVLSFVINNIHVSDVKIEEVEAESIIRKIYEGGRTV
ncbi:MAG: ATP-binding cassette domain-containing protein [Bacillota bacterium]|nr:ATP-binding cassette domain-containing protein [Bacillota bacterium]